VSCLTFLAEGSHLTRFGHVLDRGMLEFFSLDILAGLRPEAEDLESDAFVVELFVLYLLGV